MNELEFYGWIQGHMSNVNGGRVYVKPTCLPRPVPQPENPFTGRPSTALWITIYVEVGLVTPFGKTIPMGQGDTFDTCIADLKKNHPNLP